MTSAEKVVSLFGGMLAVQVAFWAARLTLNPDLINPFICGLITGLNLILLISPIREYLRER